MEQENKYLDLERGFIVLPRDLMSCPAFSTLNEVGRFIDLVFMASYKPRDIIVNAYLYTLQVGELYATAGFLAERWKISRVSVVKYLGKLITNNMIKKRTLYTSMTIITICGYGDYIGTINTSVYTSLYTSVYTNINKLNKLNNNDNDNARARTREEDFNATVIADTFQSTALLEQFCMSEGISIEQCKDYATAIVNEWRMTGEKHQSATDARKHLLAAIRIKARAERSRPVQQRTKEQAAADAFRASMQRIANSIKQDGTNY